MAALQSKTRYVRLARPGTYYARDIKWTPTNKFFIEVQPDFVLEMTQPGSDYFARYHGPTTVEMKSLFFLPSVFYLYKNFAGLSSNEKNIEPYRQKINYSGTPAELAFRSLVLREHQENVKKL